MGIVAPESLVDAMLESAVAILKAMDMVPPKLRVSPDITGRPQTGN